MTLAQKRRIACILSMILVVGAGLLSACGGATEEPADETGQRQEETAQPDEETPQQLQPVSVMLDWYPNAVHAFLYAALDQGYFAEEGLDVRIQMPAETNDPLRLVAANQVDFALSYQPQVLMARAEGIPVVSLAAVVRHPLNALMVKEDSGITSPKDLEGKRVGYPSIPTNEAILKTVLEADGADLSKVDLVDVGWDLLPAVSTDRVDALVGGYINHEQVLLEKQGIPMQAIDLTRYGVPDYYELVLVASERTVSEQREQVEAFWRALDQGYAFVVENPEQGLALLMESQNGNFPLEEDVERKSLEILLPLMDAGEQLFGYQEKSSWERVNQWLASEGVIESPVAIDGAFVDVVER